VYDELHLDFNLYMCLPESKKINYDLQPKNEEQELHSPESTTSVN
jgi:hypothetical protein